MNLKAMLTHLLCDWFHGGGRIKRDSAGRINWQCDTCGRWSPNPVMLGDEEALLSMELALNREAKRRSEG